MKKILIPALLSLAVFSSNLFAAVSDLAAVPEIEGGDKSGWSGMVGLAGLNLPEYVGSDETETLALPLIMVDYNDTFYFKVNILGAWLWKPNDSFRFGLAAMPRRGIDAGDVRAAGGTLSFDRDQQLEAGINFLWKPGNFAIETFFLKASSKSEGVSTTIRANYTLPIGRKWALIGGLHFENLDEDIVDYYYRPDGTPLGGNSESATNTSILFMAMYNISKKWVMLGGIKATQLDDVIKNSPITDDDSYNVIFAGAAWKF